MSAPAPVAPIKRDRLQSLDAFRGFTIFGMIFVIAVAAGGYQREPDHPPQRMSWFGSLPISTWFHADQGYELWKEERTAEWSRELTDDPQFKQELLQAGDTEGRKKAVEAEVVARLAAAPEANLRNVGVTFTDLIAPWFVFIVGAVLPIGRRREGAEWWSHVLLRTAFLILAGIAYISLVIQQITWWWGVLQAIGVAYFCAALTTRLPAGLPRWGAVLGLGGVNLLLTELWPAWTAPAWKSSPVPFMTLTNPNGDALRPLVIHCLPWLSISYGVMAMIGVLVGEALITKEPRTIFRRGLLVGGVFTVLGYGIHRIGFATENWSLLFNKPDVSTSYAFFTAGLGALTFLLFYWLIDVLKYRAWATVFVVFGVNPLLAYFLQIIQRRVLQSTGLIDAFSRVTPANTFVKNWAEFFGSPEAPAQWVLSLFDKGGYSGMAWGLVWTMLLWVVVRWCNRREIYWKI